MKSKVILFSTIICLLCSCSEDKPCLEDKQILETGWEKLVAFSDSNDHRYNIKSNSGITEQVGSWSSLRTNFISSQNVKGSTNCKEIHANEIDSYFELTNFEAYFTFEIERKPDRTLFTFEQRLSRRSLDEASFTIDLNSNHTTKNRFDFAYYKEKDIESDEDVAITTLDSLVGIDKTYRNLVVLTNPVFKNARIPASCLVQLVLDSTNGVVQFTTNDGEVWNVDY